MKLLPRKSLSIVWCAFLALAITGCQAIAGMTPTPTKTPRPPVTATATSTRTYTPMPTSTATSTPVPTATANPTDTPTTNPTDTPVPAPTDTPLPRNTPPPAPTPTPAEPPTNTPVPVPSVDFKVITQRMLTIEENQGCRGMHEIFIKVVDINGTPLDGITVGVDDPAGGRTELVTGEKGPGKIEFPMYGMYVVRVLRDTDRDSTSEVTRWLDSGQPTVEDLWNCGYCRADERTYDECAELRELGRGFLCFGHYSYEVVFQRQW